MYTPFRTRTKYGEGIEARQTRDLLNRPEMASCRGYVRNENSFVWQLFARYFDFNTASCQKLRKVTHNAIKISKINGAELPGLGHAIVRTEAFIVKYIEDHLSRMSELFPLLTREGDIPEEIQARLN
jgi:hypothetical protein